LKRRKSPKPESHFEIMHATVAATERRMRELLNVQIACAGKILA
jgi:hypothetical protein